MARNTVSFFFLHYFIKTYTNDNEWQNQNTFIAFEMYEYAEYNVRFDYSKRTGKHICICLCIHFIRLAENTTTTLSAYYV